MHQNATTLPPHLQGLTSWPSKAMSAKVLGHPLTWTVMTAILMLFAYLWLQSVQPTTISNIESDDTLIGSQSGQDWNPDNYSNLAEGASNPLSLPITHNKDNPRANDYRHIISKENIIFPLLKEARNYYSQEIYTGPDTANAWQRYQSILDIDPLNRQAISGQTQLLQHLKDQAISAVDNNQYETAEQWLGQLDTISFEGAFQITLRQRIIDQISATHANAEAEQRKQQRTAILNAALQDAKDALEPPVNLRVAYDLFLRALDIDENNRVATKGLTLIHQKRIEIANLAITNNDYALAQIQIERLQETHADPKQISQLISAIATAKSSETLFTQVQPSDITTPASISPNNNKSSNASANSTKTKPSRAQQSTDRRAINESHTVIASVQVLPLVSLTVTDGRKPTLTNSNDNQVALLNEGISAYYAGKYERAFERLHPLAEAGLSQAQFRLGIMYYQGRTTVKNEDLAKQWIIRALPDLLRKSAQGESWAQADLGTVYELGIGLDKDIGRAASWYRKAADQSHAGAQTNLGVLYASGEGVNYDRQKALYWLKRAASQGDKVARDNLLILNAR